MGKWIYDKLLINRQQVSPETAQHILDITSGISDPKLKAKKIYEYVIKNGKATKQELCVEFNLTALDMDTQMSIFRHCELLKGRKIDEKIYIVPFELV